MNYSRYVIVAMTWIVAAPHGVAQSSNGLTLQEVLALSKKAAASQTSVDADELRDANVSVASSSSNVLTIDLENSDNKKTSERTSGVELSREFLLGGSSRALGKKSSAISQKIQSSKRVQNNSIATADGELFIELLLQQRAAKSSRSLAEFYDARFSKSGMQSAGAVLVSKMQFLRAGIDIKAKASASAYRNLANLMNRRLGTKLSGDPFADQLVQPSSAEVGSEVLSAANAADVKLLEAEAMDLESDAELLRSRVAVTAAIGIERDWETKSDAVVAKLSLPIGQIVVDRAHARSLAGEAAMKRAEHSTATVQAEQHRILLQSRLGQLAAKVQVIEAQLSMSTSMLERAVNGAAFGADDLIETFTDIAGIDETLEQSLREYNNALVEQAVLKGDLQ